MRPRRLIDQQPRGFQLRRHFRQLELNPLKLRQGSIELTPLPAVIQSFFHGPLSQPYGCRPYRAAEKVQSYEGDFESVTLVSEE